MSRTVEIPGGHATFRDNDELRGRDRLLIKAVAMAAGPAMAKMPTEVSAGRLDGETEDESQERLAPLVSAIHFTWQEAQSLLELRQASVVATLESWTLPLPLPTMETIGDLDADLYDALDDAIGGVRGAVDGSVDLTPQPPGDNDFGDSRSSATPSVESAESPSILESQTDGGSTPTESSIPG